MSKKTFPVEFSKANVKLLLNVLDKYTEKHSFGSPVEQAAYTEAYTKLKIALFELTFIDSKE